jgi:hypothetical protein
MIDGYEYTKFGIIKKTDPVKFDYGKEYQDRLLGRGEGNRRMAYLRYGYLVGVMGRIPASVCEIGYGDGEFLRVCNDNNITACRGNEIDAATIPDGCQFINDVCAGFHDVVCFFDSLEHLAGLDWLAYLKCSYIMVSFPNCDYQSDEWFQNWFHRKPDQHIWNFSQQSITELFAYHGFEVVAVSYLEDVIRHTGKDILTMIFKKI